MLQCVGYQVYFFSSFICYKSNVSFFFLVILRLKKRVLWLKDNDLRRIAKECEAKMFFIFSHRFFLFT